jgi:hypothetical protein
MKQKKKQSDRKQSGFIPRNNRKSKKNVVDFKPVSIYVYNQKHKMKKRNEVFKIKPLGIEIRNPSKKSILLLSMIISLIKWLVIFFLYLK